MNITLKNIKHSEFASQETHCFQATVYVDGKRAFITGNNGHGGCNNYTPIKGGTSKEMYALIKEIDAELGKEKTKEYNLDNCLEFVVGDLVNQWLRDKDIKRTMKKVCYMKGKELYSIKVKPTPETIKQVQKQDWWKPEYVMLSGLPIGEVRQYFN